MAQYEWLLVDLFNLIYNLTWLVILTRQHYGKVTTTAGHIFELNVLLNVTISNFFMTLFVDLEVLPSSIMPEILGTANLYTFLTAMAGSQIETVVFLKTLNVNTMMTNTAGKIILTMTIVSLGLAVINTLALPSMIVQQSEILLCDYLTPMDFYRVTIPLTVVLAMVLLVTCFSVFRALQIKRTREICSENLHLEELGQGHDTGVKIGETFDDNHSQGRLFTIQAMISELNQMTPRELMQEDLVIQNIELSSIKTSSSMDQELIDEIRCAPIPPRDTMHEDLVIQNIELSSRKTSPSMDQELIDEIRCIPIPPRDTIEEDLVIPNIELASRETSSSMDHEMIDEIGCAPIQLPGIYVIMKTIQKYMKNAVISLLILASLLPWNLTGFYGFITNSGCEDPTIKFMAGVGEYGWYMLTMFLPFLIKLKLDRLSQ